MKSREVNMIVTMMNSMTAVDKAKLIQASCMLM